MPACRISPADRRTQTRLVGNDLLKNYGRKQYYSVQEVKQSNLRQKIDVDFACWSHAMFNSHTDFDNYHALIGEACDYVAMKSEMLSSVSTSSDAAAWFDFDFDLSWLEFPDIDLSLFDFLDF
jgi:hypothetical protein